MIGLVIFFAFIFFLAFGDVFLAWSILVPNYGVFMIKGFVHSIESFGSVDGPGIRFLNFCRAARCAASFVTIPILGQ